MSNRLAAESSPYLLQHQDNPVDWYPWGPEAFAAARAENKPIFVSIGYAACHWCHVMAHESFESSEIAALMNELFVNVKVDREERPDVDAVYMNAIHVMGEGGGWPLSAFCDYDGKPYYLGTYFPPVDKYGRPGFPSVLRMMAKVFHEQRDKVDENTEAVLEGLRRIDEHHRRVAGTSRKSLDSGALISAGRTLESATDSQHGGFGSKPKFPSSSAHELLARVSRLPFGQPARDAFLLQCRSMARGGIYDHLGGGFARYAVDERWLVPHFEKMLYDNAQLLGIFADAYALEGGDEEYGERLTQTIAYLDREMSDPHGGLYASQDADSEGEEGKFYVWTPAEIEAVLGPADALQFNRVYGVRPGGNFEHGTTVLERVVPPEGIYEEKALRSMRERLFAARRERIAPETDTKVLAGWNGLAISGLVRAWEVLAAPEALRLAVRVASFLAEHMVHDDGRRIHRVFKDGRTKLEGTIDDYAFVALGFMRLAEATLDETWWRRAVALVDTIRERFFEERDGVGIFFMTPSDADDGLVHRPESYQDGAIPSGAAVAVECLIRLGRMGGDEEALAIASSYIESRLSQAVEQPYGWSRMLSAADSLVSGGELVVTDGAGCDDLLAAARAAYAPAIAIAGPWAKELRMGKAPKDGRAAAYLCRGQTCAAPVTTVEALEALLAADARG